ncbi:MFS transporter [Wenjunlia tyrosinilytica]|uniref:MFS transporter n=1 Tax=Wenjunlia tyrosinilytica TaxID=1544741 RepID=A0A918E1U6_9ACTN|nr:MFS transporter [Wenjunlia tyrosinilytica]GGO97256.1 MFS transporter [Wenjunlia tyrosinilytica]
MTETRSTATPAADTGGKITALPDGPLERGVSVSLRRLMPLLVLMFVISFLDRVNIGFAEAGLSRDLGLSAGAFGLAAGVFFIGFAVFEVPSNLLLHRFGARRWLARIMISWGLLSASTAFAWNLSSLIVIRVVFGVAEAGFLPGVVHLLSSWFPERHRGRAMSFLFLGVVIGSVVGAPMSGALLELDGVGGLAGWQWLFLGEGVPAVLVGLWALRALPNRPSEARWLDAEATAALDRQVSLEAAAARARERFTLKKALLDRRVWRLGGCNFLLMAAIGGIAVWSADLIERVGDLRPLMVGVIAGITGACGAVGALLSGRLTARVADKRRLAAVGIVIMGVGIVCTALLPPIPAVAGLSLTMFGAMGALPALWVLPTTLATGRAAAACVAMVNTIGMFGGGVGPVVLGVAKDSTGSLRSGLFVLAAITLTAAVATATVPLAPRPRGAARDRP